MRIPHFLEAAVLDLRASRRKQNALLNEFRDDPRLQQLATAGAHVSTRVPDQPLTLSEAERAFWTMHDDEALEAFLYSELLPTLDSHLSQAQWLRLPLGYLPLYLVLSFERRRLFEGWAAARELPGNRLQYVSEAYGVLGLHEEAMALYQVRKRLDEDALAHGRETGDDDLQAAYAQRSNPFADTQVRGAQILKFVRRSPRLYAADQ